MAAIGPRLVIATALALAVLGATAHADGSGHWMGPGEIYNKVCTYCHDAGVSPVILGRAIAPEETRWMVRYGRNGMPAFRESEFNDAELAELSVWLANSPPPTTAETQK